VGQLAVVARERRRDRPGCADDALEVVRLRTADRLRGQGHALERALPVGERGVQARGPAVAQGAAVLADSDLQLAPRRMRQGGEDLVELDGRGGLADRDRAALAELGGA